MTSSSANPACSEDPPTNEATAQRALSFGPVSELPRRAGNDAARALPRECSRTMLPGHMELVRISRELSRAVDRLPWGEAAHTVYNPLKYARDPHERYLETFGQGPKEVIWLGMNPGPYGMAQTGVPFGDVHMVRDWMGIQGKVRRPKTEHPKRPILGFDCPRREVSGTRLWGFAEDRFGSPEAFFRRFFVVNYCPLVFMDEGARNVTPDKLPRGFREELSEHCDRALRKTVEVLEPRWVLGVGAFAHRQAVRALEGLDVRQGTILHPSPASPRANRGWAEQVHQQLAELKIRV